MKLCHRFFFIFLLAVLLSYFLLYSNNTKTFIFSFLLKSLLKKFPFHALWTTLCFSIGLVIFQVTAVLGAGLVFHRVDDGYVCGCS